MAVEISDAFNLVDFPFEFNLIALHDFLDGGTDITQSRVDSGGLNTSLCGLLDALHQRVVLFVEGESPRTVYDPALDVSSKVHLDDVVVLEDGVVPGVGSVVSGDVVEGATCGESDT